VLKYDVKDKLPPLLLL